MRDSGALTELLLTRCTEKLRFPPREGLWRSDWDHTVVSEVYHLADVREAYQDLARRHTRGKIVLVP